LPARLYLILFSALTSGQALSQGIVWIPLMGRISDMLYQYLQSVQSYLAPPVAAVFPLGVFFKRINATGAFTAMVTSFLSVSKLTLEMVKGDLSGIWYQLPPSISFTSVFCYSCFL
jgi:solute:Na+ symporter, SSS family